jgi:RNA polymerase sigma factor (sigma-70 family)
MPHETPPLEGSITAVLSQLRHCDKAALTVIWTRFFPRLSGLARKSLRSLPRCTADGDDVAQSALISFWQAVEKGREFELADRDDLWNLLAVIAVRKARKMARRESALKRGGSRVITESDIVMDDPDSAGSQARLDELLSDVSPAEFDVFCSELLETLPEDLRITTVLRLQGHSTAETAEILKTNQRAVQRQLETVRAAWEAADGSWEHRSEK